MSDEGEQLRIVRAEIQSAQRDIASMDMQYARKRMRRVNAEADRSLHTLPPQLQAPFLEIMRIAQGKIKDWANG